ncbi:MAG TPA: hypothetical protein VFV55_05300 [Usitatibacteraceae bacterium]|nr:hypothetical protein [Usitatibacteraceae bacterium]
MGRHGVAVLVLLAAAIAGCGKEAPKADAATERKEALERAKEGAFGAPVKALEDAKGMGADLDRKARDAVDKAEQDAK